MEKSIKPFLLISKPYGLTSSGLLNQIKHSIGKIKTGHTGTLDPIATGLLIVALGYGTRLIPFIDTNIKEYYIKIIFGIQTDTDDITGNIIRRSTNSINANDLKDAISNLIGEVEQYPPLYSAKKVSGKEMYKYARGNQQIPVIKPSSVKILDVEIIDLKCDSAILRVVCSKGTYMRSIARDLGIMLGTFGTIGAIARTKIGKFKIEDATTISRIKNGDFEKGFISAEESLNLPALIIKNKRDFRNGLDIALESSVKEGKFLPTDMASFQELTGISDKIIARSEDGEFLGIALLKNNFLHPEVVINENN